MSSLTIAFISFACIFAGVLLGLLIRSYLPAHHLSVEARDTVKLGAGLIATLAALVLGLLVSSAKGTLDSLNTELTQDGAKIILLDRVLAKYGPETKEVRKLLRSHVKSAIERIWPEDKSSQVNFAPFEATRITERIQDELCELTPRTASQSQLQSRALQIAADLAQSRWTVIVQMRQTLPPVFFVVLLTWLAMLFACFGLLSPGNATVITVLFVCALSVSGAIFLINEMNSPFTGIIKISSAPLHTALDNLGK